MTKTIPHDGSMAGPLAGLTVIEMAGLGPVPLAGLMLSEMGARVVRVERKGAGGSFLKIKPQFNLDRHGREVLAIDLKNKDGVETLLRLADKADVLMEGFRPGVMERLGLGPEECQTRNPKLIYARMTGFGQDGPLASTAGHDLTYLAYSGALHAIGRRGTKPVPPLNLVADYGGGTMFLIAGILAALFERVQSGKGQIVDAAMIDGVSMLCAPFFSFMASGFWAEKRGENLLDSGAPFYDTYETSDGKHVAIACLEPQFFAEFVKLADLPAQFVARQYDPAIWPEMRAAIAGCMMAKTRDQWAEVFEQTDACVAPVLTFSEAAKHPHNVARYTHSTDQGMLRPAPAPRFSRSSGAVADSAQQKSNEPAWLLSTFGFSDNEVEALTKAGIVEAAR